MRSAAVLERFRVAIERAVRSRYGRHTGALHRLNGRHFVTHHANYVGCRADKDKTTAFYPLGKIGIFS